MQSYLDHRDVEIDPTEWLDIKWSLQYLTRIHGEENSGFIVELCAGKGYLVSRLKRWFPDYFVFGYDIEGYKYSDNVSKIDLETTDPSPADYYVFQHCLEHLNQDRVVDLLTYMARNSKGYVGILPGHYVDDPTHIINHYHVGEVKRIVEEVGRRLESIKAIYYCIRPDILSYIYPEYMDYLVVVSDRPVKCFRTLPFKYRTLRGIVRRMLERERGVNI